MIVADDQDGNIVTMCHNHPDEPATGEDLYGHPLCDGCARGYDAMNEAAQEWDDNDG